MTYERHIARMTLHDPDSNDTFPERHALDQPSGSGTQADAQDEHNPATTLEKPWRRRPRRRSESVEGYKMRDSYWEAMDIIDQDLREAVKAPAVWDYVYDPVCLPPSRGAKTPAIRRLGSLPIQRAWRRRNSREAPDLTSTRIIEAVMVYERGMMLPLQSRCTHCRRSQGISPGCVIIHSEDDQSALPKSDERKPTCSNCLYDGKIIECDARIPAGSNQPPRTQTPSQIKGSFASNPTHLEVLKLVDKLVESKRKDGKEDVISRAKQIEMAALEIAQAAHEWGLGVKEKRRKNVDPTDSTY
ncbi:hypothetical protein M426DRAFT_17729 [Hypoxylon sp. CI-4A]|nr:hypothetical protein M426DRAFT_17729 [Hypoxylon sp. CI-4A]